MNAVLFAGGNISLQCNASGRPMPSVNWYKSGQLLQVSGGSRVSISNTVLLEDQTIASTLAFQELQLSDDADYYCEANNTGANDIVFSVISPTVHLTVQRERKTIFIFFCFC